MDILIIIVLAVMVVAFRLLKLGSWFSPWTLTAAIWLGIMILIQLQGDMLYPLTDQFRISLALWVPILCGSALITYHGMGVREANDTSHATQSGASFSPLLYNLLYVISMVLTPLMLLQIIKVVSQFDATDLLFNIRTLAVEGEQNYGFLLYSFVLNQVLLVVGLWEYPRVPLWQLLTIYLATFLNFFAILEKGILFFALVCTLFVLYEKKVIKARSIAIAIGLVVVVFFVITIARQIQSEDTGEEMTFFDFIIIYITSAPVAYGRVVEDLSTQFGSHTFSIVYLFLDRFGFDVEVNTKLQEFVFVPLPTNVYTIFQPFFQDFGQRGVAFFALVYGVASGWAYRLYREGNGPARCLYTYLAEVLILQFYQENIFQSMVVFGQFVFFSFLLTQNKFTIALPHAAEKATTVEKHDGD